MSPMDVEHLDEIAERLIASEKVLNDEANSNLLNTVDEAVERIGAAWSGSWLGHHSRV